MACRCQERREILKRAIQSKSASDAVKAVRFVGRTSVQDLRQVLVLKDKAK